MRDECKAFRRRVRPLHRQQRQRILSHVAGIAAILPSVVERHFSEFCESVARGESGGQGLEVTFRSCPPVLSQARRPLVTSRRASDRIAQISCRTGVDG